MNVVFFTEGGRQMGLGHVARCASLQYEFKERGMKADLIVNGDTSIAGHTLLNWCEQKEKTAALLNSADIVVVDSYLAPLEFYQQVSKKARLALYIDDLKRLDYPAGIVLNYAVGAEKLDYPDRPEVDYLVGAKFALFRPQFSNFSKDRKFPDRLKTILVMFGGNDLRNLTVPMVRTLIQAFPSSQLKVIIGAGAKNQTEVKALNSDRVDVLGNPPVEKLVEAMAQADAAVSAGGQTLYEMAVMSLPVVTVCVIDNQQNIINGFRDAGYVEDAGRWDKKTLHADVVAGLKRLEKGTVRKLKSQSGRRIIDGLGSRRVVDAVLEKLKK